MSDQDQQAAWASEQTESAAAMLAEARETWNEVSQLYTKAAAARREAASNLSLAVRSYEQAKRHRRHCQVLLVLCIIVLILHWVF